MTETNWKAEQRNDPYISRILNILGSNATLSKTELKAEPSEVQKYLRHRSALNIRDEILYRKSIVDQEDIFS